MENHSGWFFTQHEDAYYDADDGTSDTPDEKIVFEGKQISFDDQGTTDDTPLSDMA